MTEDEIAAFLARERLPESFRTTLERVCRPLAARAAALRAARGRTVFVGLCGAQGSGKSTISEAATAILTAQGLKAVTLSLDDFYLSREARAWLARKVHPLMAVRGPPGTHDVALACVVLDHLSLPGVTPLPAFDKASDERRPQSAWREVEGPLDVVILEGWCVGAQPQPRAELVNPVNSLERAEDPDGVWRRYVDRQLAGPYQALFARLDMLVLLAAPGFEVVRAWRTEQEHKLRARTQGGMDDDAVARFVAHYDRLTRWVLDERPSRADGTIPLAADRTPGV
ncbi:MAG: kinase [Alphaproteobacteria bacterium]